MNNLSRIQDRDDRFALPDFGNVSVAHTKQEKGREGGSIFAGDMKLLSEIDQRKQRGRKEAMRIVSDAFDREVSIDKKVERMRGRASELKGEIADQQKELDLHKANLEKIKKDHGFDDEEQLEADLGAYLKDHSTK